MGRNLREVNQEDPSLREVSPAGRSLQEADHRRQAEVNQEDPSHQEAAPPEAEPREDHSHRPRGARSLRVDSRHPARESTRGYWRRSLTRDCQGNG